MMRYWKQGPDPCLSTKTDLRQDDVAAESENLAESRTSDFGLALQPWQQYQA